MERIVLSILALAGLTISAQSTNSFPANGNATINDGHLIQTGSSNYISTQGPIKLKNYLLFDSDGDFTGSNYFTIQDEPSGNYLRMGYGFGSNFTISSSGNIGIGVNSPDAKLHIYGSNAGQGNVLSAIMLGKHNGPEIQVIQESADDDVQGMVFKVKSSATNADPNFEAMRISKNGNVGIGTSYTSYGILTVNGDSYSGIRIENDVYGKEANMRFRSKSSSGTTYHADIATFHNGTNGFIGIKSPHNNTPGAGYKFIVNNIGNVGIGTTSPDSKLTVKGKIHSEEVKVDLSVPGPDYVFKEDYDLKSLDEVQSYIQEHGHLPNIPSAMEMVTNGIQLGEMNMKLLEKIEELTLYTLQQEVKIDKNRKLQSEIETLKKINNMLLKRIEKLEMIKSKKL